MTDSGYTPSMEDLRKAWIYFTNRDDKRWRQRGEGNEEIDRFFAAHDAVIREDQAKKDAVSARMRAQEFRNSVKAAWDNGEAMNLDARLAAVFALDEFSLLLTAQSLTGTESE